MSITTITNSINQLNKEISTLEKSMADEMKKEAEKNKRINEINRSINKNTSPSALQSKSRQINTYINDLSKIATKKADISKKLAEKRINLNAKTLKLQKEQIAESKKSERQQIQIAKQYQDRISELILQTQSVPSRNMTNHGFSDFINKNISHDVFISHASEDKDTFVRELAVTLQDKYGVNVWYDEFSISWGDSLRSAIDKGLANSRFGIVVISRSFIKKGWTQLELDGLLQMETPDKKIILPIWHDITVNEVKAFSPSLAGRKALSTSMFTVDEIAMELTKLLNKLKEEEGE